MEDSLIPLKEEHHYLESIIARGRETFIEVGTVLMTIREKRTYRTDGWDTFEEYCQERWGWTRQRAYQLMDSAETMGVLSTRVDIPLPQNEKQVRALAALPTPEAKKEVWEQAVSEYGAQPTHEQVREAVRLFKADPPSATEEAAQRDMAAYWRDSDIVHRALSNLNTATMVEASEYVRRLGGLNAISVFLENDLAIAESAQAWLREYADALRKRLGIESQQIRRVQ